MAWFWFLGSHFPLYLGDSSSCVLLWLFTACFCPFHAFFCGEQAFICSKNILYLEFVFFSSLFVSSSVFPHQSCVSPAFSVHWSCLHVFSLCFCLCSQCFIGLYNISLLYETVFGFAPACVLVLCCLPVCSLHPNTFVLLQYWLIIWLSQANKALKISSTAILVFHAIAYMVKFNQYIMISFYYQFVKEGNCIFYVAKHKNNLNAAQYVLSLQIDCQWQCGEWRYFWWSYSRNVLQRRGLNDGEGFKATHLQGLEEVNQMFWGSLFICAGAMYALGMVMSFQTTHGCVSTTYFFTAGIPHTFV